MSTGTDNTGSNNLTTPGDNETRTNLIINYLPQSLTDKELENIFITVGTIKNVRIMRDQKVGTYLNLMFGILLYRANK